MDPSLSIACGVLAGATFSTIVGTWRRGLAVGILCGLLTAFLLFAATIPVLLLLGNVTRLT